MSSNLRKLQLIDVAILDEIVKILAKYGLKYFLIGGTLLGAVRHQGFIPWDDDMDIAMPREDYELFLKKFAQELPTYLHVKNFKTDHTYKYYITRILDDRYKVKELRDANAETATTNLSIDIFPIDGTPDNKYQRKMYYLQIMALRATISLIQQENIDTERKRQAYEKMLISFGTKLPLDKFLSANALQHQIDKLLKKQPNDSHFIGTIMGAYRTKEIVPKEYFGRGTLVDFEGRQLVAPAQYDRYLTHMYGDYMKLPSSEEIQSKRHFVFVK